MNLDKPAMKFFYKGFRFVMVPMALSSLSACLVGPDFSTPSPPRVKHYTGYPWPSRTVSVRGKGGVSQQFIESKRISAQWWRLFCSPQLNELVCMGLANSPNLKAAKAVLVEAQENLNVGIGNELFPMFSAQLSAQRGSSAGFFGASSSDTAVTSNNIPTHSIFNLFNASVNVAYVLDIFGGARRQIEALRSEVDYQYFEFQAAYLSLAANIVTTAIKVASLRKQICITKRLISEQAHQLYIIEKQFQLGGVAKSNVLEQQTQLDQTRATLPPLYKNWHQARHLLAVLMGIFPSEECLIPELDLDQLHLPKRLPLSIPSSLVRQRPDIRAAEALWKKANAEVGVATSNLYPQLTINGTYGKASMGGSQFFNPRSSLWNISGALLQPIFRGGALLAARRAAIAAYYQAAEQYRQVVLQAFQNVADTLRALETDARELKAQKQAELSAHASLNLVRQQFYLGGVDYLALLDAQRQYQKTRINLIQSQANRYIDTAALFQSLGGGWWNC